MGQHSKQNHRIDEIVAFLATAYDENIDLNSSAVRDLRTLVEAHVVRSDRQFMTRNQWQGYRVFESCANKSRLDAAGRERRLSDKRNYDELRAAIAEPPMLAVAMAVDPRMVDSAHNLIMRRERFSRPRRLRTPSTRCC